MASLAKVSELKRRFEVCKAKKFTLGHSTIPVLAYLQEKKKTVS